jgi:hypothetical protein
MKKVIRLEKRRSTGKIAARAKNILEAVKHQFSVQLSRALQSKHIENLEQTFFP